MLELACKYILIIRLRQVAFEAVQHKCAFANCTTCAFEIDDAELLLLFIYLFILNHSCLDSIDCIVIMIVIKFAG